MTGTAQLTSRDTVYAAGAVCWREVDGEPRILLIHRPNHKDVSLPKGKVDPGESAPQTAVREIFEETGIAVTLGAPLGTSEYELPGGRPKIVYYWSAEATGKGLGAKKFTPNGEVDRIEWATVRKARRVLTYAHDVDVIERFAERFQRGRARTYPLVALRHAKAVPRQHWDGPDHTRPLLHRGRERAGQIVPTLLSWGVKVVVASPAARCRETVEPLAALLDADVKIAKGISQDAWEEGKDTVDKVIAKRLKKAKPAVLCSHGPVLPEILSQIATQTGSPISKELQKAAGLGTGDFAVLHLNADPLDPGIVAVERFDGDSVLDR